jgi:hypothetical protein
MLNNKLFFFTANAVKMKMHHLTQETSNGTLYNCTYNVNKSFQILTIFISIAKNGSHHFKLKYSMSYKRQNMKLPIQTDDSTKLSYSFTQMKGNIILKKTT